MESYKKEDIPTLYLNNKMSTTEIAQLMGMSPSGVSYYLRSRGFSSRTRGEANKIAKRIYGKQNKDVTNDDREEIVRLYVVEKESTGQIGKRYNMKHGSIRSILHTRGIKLRSTSEGLKERYPDGRVGGLASNWKGGVRGVGKGRKYICVYCPKHPNATKEGYVMQHRLEFERSHATEKAELESARLRQLLIDNGINPDPVA